jgi:hypothetical protein
VENIFNIHRKNILKGKVASFANKMTRKLRTYPCTSARLGINGLERAVEEENAGEIYIKNLPPSTVYSRVS